MNRAQHFGVGMLALAGVGILLAGCGAAPAAKTSASVTTPTPSAGGVQGSTAGDCLLGANGADVEVGIANPTTSCGQWITNLAGIGLTWDFIGELVTPGQPGTADQETMQQVCDLTNGTEELYVEDAGGQSYGNSICSQEEQNGWTPESSPGPLAAQEQQAEQQQAQASASASAAAAQASASSQASTDDEELDSDVSQLGKDYSAWQSDVATADSAYQSLLSEPLCQDGSSDSDTYSDAASVYSDGATVYSDESTLSSDISTVQNDISTLQSDESSAGTTQYNSDISAAQAAVSKAQAAVNAGDSSKIENEADAIENKTDDCGS
jgi:hypothetical protein